MIVALSLTLGLAAWVTFIYCQYHFGDRPTSPQWFAMMLGLDVFEYGKGLFSLIEFGVPALPVSITAAVLTACVALLWQTRRDEIVAELGGESLMGSRA